MAAGGLVVALALAGFASVAVADTMTHEVPVKARALAEAGRDAYNRADYGTAISSYTEAYALAPVPALLFDTAQAYRLAGRCDDAAVMYRRYLQSDPPPEARVLAESHLQTVDRCREPVPVFTDVAGLGTQLSGRSDIDAGGRPRGIHDPKHQRDIGLGLAAGGGIALGLAAVYAVRAHDASDEVSAAYAKGGDWSKLAAIDAQGRHSAAVAEVSGTIGVAAAGGGLLLYYLGVRNERALHVAQSVSAGTTTGGAKVSVGWKF